MIDIAESSRHDVLYKRLWLPVGRLVVKGLLFLLGPVRVRGSYRVPKSGGVLVLANHVADIDPVVLQSACPRPIHFMAKSELFDMPVIGRLQRAFGSFPVNRSQPDRAALKLSAKLLRDGDAVGVFPEGQLSEDGRLQEIKGGIALIIRMAAGVPVICCGINGTERIVPYGKVVPRPAFHRVDVTWGEPMVFSAEATSDEILGWVQGQLSSLANPEGEP